MKGKLRTILTIVSATVRMVPNKSYKNVESASKSVSTVVSQIRLQYETRKQILYS